MHFRVKLLFVLFSILFSSTVFSQEIQWSEPGITNPKLPYHKVLGYDDEGFFLLLSNLGMDNDRDRVGFKKRRYGLAYFDDNLKKSWEQEIETGDEVLQDIIFAAGRIWMLSSEEDRSLKKQYVYLRQIGVKGAWKGSRIKVDEWDNSEAIVNSSQISVSKDHQHMLLSYNLETPNRADQAMRAISIDTSGVVSWAAKIVLPYKEKNLNRISTLISNKNRLFILGLAFHAEQKEKGPGKSSYRFFDFDPTDQTLKEEEIRFEDRFISDVGISIDEINDKVVMAGFFSDKNTYSTAGVFFNSYDPQSRSTKEMRSERFPDAYLTRFIGEFKANKGKELTNYTIDRLILRNDGGAVIVAEAFYRDEYTYYDVFTQTFTRRVIYNYNNVLVVSVNKDGSIDWGSIVPKNQSSVDDGGFYSSYLNYIDQDQMIYIYNTLAGKRNAVMLYQVTNRGTENQRMLFKENEEVQIVAKGGMQIDTDMVILPATFKKKSRLLKIVF